MQSGHLSARRRFIHISRVAPFAPKCLMFAAIGGGCILNISATLHWSGEVAQVHAGSAKSAIEAMTRHLAVEWGSDKVRVNAIAPGLIEGTEGASRLTGTVVYKGYTVGDIIKFCSPLERAGTLDDVSQAAAFLCSDAASYVTGVTLAVDGATWLTFHSLPLMRASKLMGKL
jgi:2,4-dienoyl-CoA reductase [(3E)-enoyl-CoA-producing], peroxisomal